MTQAADLVSARVAARAQGVRVEALSERTDTTTTWVNPDGSRTSEVSAAPVRFKDASGHWQPIDLDLKAAGADVVPAAGGPGVHLSAGGAAGTDVTSLDHGAGRSVSWALGGGFGKVKLPAPVLAGRTATYPNVLPGVDVRVSVRPSGFEQDFVIKDRAAADQLAAAASAGGAGGSFSIPLKIKGLTAKATADGGIAFMDGKGKQVSTIPPATAWDAQVDPHSGDPASVSPVKLSAAQTNPGHAMLTVTPDLAWLADPARKFPVTIDPTYASMTVTPSFDTWVENTYSTDQSTSTELKVGTFDGGSSVARSYINFPITGFHNLKVESAQLSVYETWSYSCTAAGMNVFNASPATTSTRWTAQPGSGTTVWGSVNVAKGFSSGCGAGWVNVPMTSLFQALSTNTAVTSTAVLLKAASETDSNGWKKFSSMEGANPPKFTLTYDRKPNVAGAPVLGGAGQSSSGVWYAATLTPTFTSTATDPDGNNVTMTTEVHTNNTDGTATAGVASCAAASTASGRSASCTLSSPLGDNATYYARTKVQDDQGLWNGAWSPWTQFKTAATKPAPSTAICTGYPDGQWQTKPAGPNASCTLTATDTGTPSAPATVYAIIDGKNLNTPLTGASPLAVSVATTNGRHTIEHWSMSRAGLESAHTTYSFGVGAAAMTYPAPNTATPATGPIKITVTGPPASTTSVATTVTAALKWRVSGSSQGATGTDWHSDPTPMPVTQAADGSELVNGVWDVSKVDPATGGQATQTTSRAPIKLDVQVCLSYDTTVQCTYDTAPASVLRVPHAFGNGFPTQTAGPGQVALFTGEFNTSATDVSIPGYTGTLSLSRSHSTYANLPSAYVPPAASVFGPGWSASIGGSDAGLGRLVPYDGTRDDGTLQFIDEDGTALVYQATSAGLRRTSDNFTTGTWIPSNDDTRLSGTTFSVSGLFADTQLKLTEADGTVTTFRPSTPSSYPKSGSPGLFTANSVAEAGGATTTMTIDQATGRVTRILAPLPDGMTATDCPDTGTVKAGCRALRLVYGSTGQLTQVNLEAWAPEKLTVTDCAGGTTSVAAGTMASIPVACYSYNASSQLAKITDPRSNLATSYTYGSTNEITGVTPPGLAPFTISYAAPSGTSQLKVTAVTRANPSGSGSTSLARFVYGAAPSNSNAAAGTTVPDLSAGTVAKWGQDAAPTYAAAVFGPDYTGPVPDALTGAGTGIDWTYADLSYTDAQGYTTNTATFGADKWLYGYTDYDQLGNVVFTLDTHATATILADAAAGTRDNVAPLGTTTIYNSDSTTSAPLPGQPAHTPAGAVVTDVYAPRRTVTLTEGPKAGTRLPIRPRTHTDYDQAAPNSGLNPATATAAADQRGYALPTTVTTYAADSTENTPPASTTAPVISRTLTGYASKSGALTDPDSGWTLGRPTKTVTDMDLSGTENTGDLVAVTYYDAHGRTIEARQPSESTSPNGLPAAGAGTTLTDYYTYTTGKDDPSTCQSGAWAGLVCHTRKAAQPAGSTLPDSVVKAYSYLLAPSTTLETSGAVVRTTNATYLLDGRPDTTETAVTGLASSSPLPGTKTNYDAKTGIATGTTPVDANGNPTGAASSSIVDSWGRTTSTTSSQGDTTTTSYDPAGHVAAVTDPKNMGITRYTYDGTDANHALERRGLVTKVTVTRKDTTDTASTNLLTYTGAYDDTGALAAETMPGGLTQNWQHDEAGQATEVNYTGQVTNYTTDTSTDPPTYTPTTVDPHGTWLAWTQDRDETGKVVAEYNGPSAAFDGNPGVTDPANIQAPTGVGDARAADRAYSYDRAGRLTRVTDRIAAARGAEADPTTTASEALPCTVRNYGFDANPNANNNSNGNRTSLTVDTHNDGNCTGTVDTHTATTYAYDTADRPISGGNTGTNTPGAYSYDPLGRQTTIPAADAPDPSKGDITLGYYDTDLAHTITQGASGSSTTTTYTLDEQQRRTTSVTGPTGAAAGAANTTTTVRHYTDNSDNPAWTDVTTVDATGTAQPAVTTRYTESLDGNLGAQINADSTNQATYGSATLTLGNPHGDAVTTVTIPAGTDESTPAVCINGWADYTEYGAPTSTTSTSAEAGVAGTIGYGWLGLKQRATPTEAAGLTLMGVRLYNPTRGLFTSLDPVDAGNTTEYAYPQDPVNANDVTGKYRNYSYTWHYYGGRRHYTYNYNYSARRAHYGSNYARRQYRKTSRYSRPNRRSQYVSVGYRAQPAEFSGPCLMGDALSLLSAIGMIVAGPEVGLPLTAYGYGTYFGGVYAGSECKGPPADPLTVSLANLNVWMNV